MKQKKAREAILKQPQNGARLGPKLTPRSKRIKTKEKHKWRRHLQRKNSLFSMGNEVSRRVSTLDMPRKAI
jgi:hypothetical protein